MIERLDSLADEIGNLQSKLALLIGPPRSGKGGLIRNLALRRKNLVLNVGVALGRQLLAVPGHRRHLKAAELLRSLADECANDGLILLDNLELLFDRTLQLNPLDLLKRNAHARRVIAVWPGQIHDNRLTYASMGHPEYQDYAINGLVPFRID